MIRRASLLTCAALALVALGATPGYASTRQVKAACVRLQDVRDALVALSTYSSSAGASGSQSASYWNETRSAVRSFSKAANRSGHRKIASVGRSLRTAWAQMDGSTPNTTQRNAAIKKLLKAFKRADAPCREAGQAISD